jgi:glycosyltransferase involved in cell wall biosynthesis
MAARFEELAASPSLVATLGARGRRFAETFTWERAARESAAHLAEVVDG